MDNKSHATEIMQKTRLALENGDVSFEEIDSAIRVSTYSVSERPREINRKICALTGIVRFVR